MSKLTMRGLTIVVALGCLFGMPSIETTSGQGLKFSAKDRKIIISMALSHSMSESGDLKACDTLILKNKKVVFLSTKNVDRKHLPELEGIHLELMTPEEIEEEIKTNKSQCWVELGELRDLKTAVSVQVSTWAVFKLCPKCIRDESGTILTYEATKKQGQWEIKLKRKGQVST